MSKEEVKKVSAEPSTSELAAEEEKWRAEFVSEDFACGQKSSEESYEEAVKRLRKRREDFFASLPQLLQETQQSLAPKVTAAKVKEFEAALGVTLPVDYKRFLLEVGDGGDSDAMNSHVLRSTRTLLSM